MSEPRDWFSRCVAVALAAAFEAWSCYDMPFWSSFLYALKIELKGKQCSRHS